MTEQRLLELLEKHELKITTAESCTGGLVAGLLCDISGISAHFEEGFITYSKEVKNRTLGVPESLMEEYGVVSRKTAEAMALGAAKKAGAHCAVATTGIAGPTGGTKEAPVGCVCIACVVNGQVHSERMIFNGTRMEVRMQAASYALEMLCNQIEDVLELAIL